MIVGLCPPAHAQTAAPAALQDGPAIVVHGRTEAKSDWLRAEGDHVVVFSRGGEGELRRVTRNLDLLHGLMSRLYRRGDTSDDALKVQVTLIDSESRLAAMRLGDLRAQEGPFPAAFSAQHHYDPRADGEVIAIARTDRLIRLDTSRRFNLECDEYHATGGVGFCSENARRSPPIVRSWESAVYAAFARRFMLTYVPAAYPRWYLDGLGALFATFQPESDGAMDYAGAPAGFRDVFKSYGYPDIAGILEGRYLDDAGAVEGWSPYGAWLLTHYLVFGVPKAERQAQFQYYMAAIRQGAAPAEAAKAFGDLGKLQREVMAYAKSRLLFAHADAPATPPAEPLITPLSAAQGALVEARVEIESRLAQPSSGPDAEAGRAGWLERVRDSVARYPDDADALLFAAEAECRSGHDAQCLTAADRLLARSPGSAGALAWRGVALTGLAVAGPPADRLARLAEARGAIGRAIALDGLSPLPRLALFQSFTRAGEPVPEDAMRGMGMVIRAVPAAPGPRLELGRELIRQGKRDLARTMLWPVVSGTYDSSEKRAAAALLPPASGG